MNINHSEYTISEIYEMIKRKDLVVNREYQRSNKVWPLSAKTYLIDTILEGFPFPKVYFYQSIHPSTLKSFKEIVDGQQRITTIVDFIDNKIRLSSKSNKHRGLFFNDLEEEKKQQFMLFGVQTDVILGAERSDLLEMFRRINGYTAPLNRAESRHAKYQGAFKWFILEMADRFTRYFEEFRILTPKQIIRMGDSELLTDLALVIHLGAVSKSLPTFNKIYLNFDKEFLEEDKYRDIISSCLDTIFVDFADLQNTFMMKTYALHSLFTAMVHLKYGILNGTEVFGVEPTGRFYQNKDKAIAGLIRLAEAHETQEIDGEFSDYVTACLGTTTKVRQRVTRTKAILEFLIED